MVFSIFFVAMIQEDFSRPHTERLSLHPHFQQDGCTATSLPPLGNLLPFCHPAGLHTIQRSEYTPPREHCFTLTGADASRLHGFCRQTLPPVENGELLRFPRVLCIVSPYLWPDFYYKALQFIDQLLRVHPPVLDSLDEVGSGGLPLMLPKDCPAADFLMQLRDASHPPLGTTLSISIPRVNEKQLDIPPTRSFQASTELPTANTRTSSTGGAGSTHSYVLQVPSAQGFASSFAGVPVARLLWHVTPRQARSLLASLLLERRIIIKAEDPQTVALAVHAAVSMLHPFTWHHVYLPLLPDVMHGILAAPMPLIAGVLSSTFAKTEVDSLEGAVVVDLDRKGVSIPEVGSLHDDALLLPDTERLVIALETAREKMSGPSDASVTPLVAAALRDWFVGKVFGQYRQYLSKDWGRGEGMPDDDGAIRKDGFVFDYNAFVAAQRRRSERHVLFLDSFRHSQMLEVFIGQRLALAAHGYDSCDAFESAVEARANSGFKSKGLKVAGLLRKSSGRVPAAVFDNAEVEGAVESASPSIPIISTPAAGATTAAKTVDKQSVSTLPYNVAPFNAEKGDIEHVPRAITELDGIPVEHFPPPVAPTPSATEHLPLIDLDQEDYGISNKDPQMCLLDSIGALIRAEKEENGFSRAGFLQPAVQHGAASAQPQADHLHEALSTLHIEPNLSVREQQCKESVACTSWVPFNTLTPAGEIGSTGSGVPSAPGPLESGIQPARMESPPASSSLCIGPLQNGVVQSMQWRVKSPPGSIAVKDDAFGPLLTAAAADVKARHSIQLNK